MEPLKIYDRFPHFHLKYLCLFVSLHTHNNICASNQQKKPWVFFMPRQRGIYSRSNSRSIKITLIESSRFISFSPSLNNTPSSPPSSTDSKIKPLPEEKSDDSFSEGIGYYYSLSPLVIDGDFKIWDVSDGNCSMNNRTLSCQDLCSNNGDVSSVNGF